MGIGAGTGARLDAGVIGAGAAETGSAGAGVEVGAAGTRAGACAAASGTGETDAADACAAESGAVGAGAEVGTAEAGVEAGAAASGTGEAGSAESRAEARAADTGAGETGAPEPGTAELGTRATGAGKTGVARAGAETHTVGTDAAEAISTGRPRPVNTRPRNGRWRAVNTRSRTGRWRRALLAALVTGALVIPLSAAAQPKIPAPVPAVLAPLTPATLDEAYAANRANAAEASRMAAADADDRRAAVDRAMADPDRHFLAFDGRGSGQATEVLGDLAHADRVAVLVPGSDTSLDTYDRFRATALNLHRQLTRDAPNSRTAVVSWLGYDTPRTVSTTVLTAGRADQAAPHLREFIRQLHAVTGREAHVTLVCHSYGTVVCGRAAAGLAVSGIALVGSPGTGVDSAAALHTRARVWAARGAADWVADVPHVSADLFGTTVGFGTDPVSPAFGAHVFAAGDGGHSDYFTPGSASLANLARIVLGETSEVTHA